LLFAIGTFNYKSNLLFICLFSSTNNNRDKTVNGTALDFSKQSLLSCEDWSTLRLVHLDDLVESVSSYLIIKAPDFDIVAKLSPLEVYSADNLGQFLHSRMSGDANFFPNDEIGSRVMSIGPNIPCVIDPSGLYHVAREGSSHFAEYSHLLVDENECSNLCQAVIKYGKTDGSRSAGQFRVNFGCGGQHMPGGVPAKLVGFDFETRLHDDDCFDSVATLKLVGSLTEFLWNVMVGIQREAKDPPIAPDKRRHEEYGRVLSRKLNMDDSVGFEDITLVVAILSPRFDGVNEHSDKMNDSLVGYRRTGTLNICLVLGEIIIQLQVRHASTIIAFLILSMSILTTCTNLPRS
jgi:hypothetical protein